MRNTPELFTVLDLETTGGSTAADAITEIGAVRLYEDGRIDGVFHTLVNPMRPIGDFVSALTGITDGMLTDQPTVEVVLPEFLAFAADSVLVAHNAPFDIGFLRAAASQCDIDWPLTRVIDTVTLAREVLAPDAVPNHKLATLANYVGARIAPNHRALADAHATADVLLALLAKHPAQTSQARTPHIGSAL
jgi:DNA polymerase-3 subunit epsilon